MTRKLGLLVLVGAVAFACGEAGQSMSGGAGAMDGGGGATNGTGATGGTPGQNVRVECNKSEARRVSDAATYTYHWAEFEVDPGVTEVTVCHQAIDTRINPPYRDWCSRAKASWYEGTNTGWAYCGQGIDFDNPDTPDREYMAPIRVTVHR